MYTKFTIQNTFRFDICKNKVKNIILHDFGNLPEICGRNTKFGPSIRNNLGPNSAKFI